MTMEVPLNNLNLSSPTGMMDSFIIENPFGGARNAPSEQITIELYDGDNKMEILDLDPCVPIIFEITISNLKKEAEDIPECRYYNEVNLDYKKILLAFFVR